MSLVGFHFSASFTIQTMSHHQSSFCCIQMISRFLFSISIVVADGCAITSISYRSWINREARDPSLLVNVAKNSLCLFRSVAVLSEILGFEKRRYFERQCSL